MGLIRPLELGRLEERGLTDLPPLRLGPALRLGPIRARLDGLAARPLLRFDPREIPRKLGRFGEARCPPECPTDLGAARRLDLPPRALR